MRKAFIVTDLGYGDTGKGTTVDFLSRQYENSLVIRHCGGAQAAHNVITPDGRHHTFAQFGSGSFVPGTRTHLSRFMVINPLNMIFEARHLIELGVRDIWQRTTVDGEALIITPWQKALNHIRETLRAENVHGSCGQGVGETVCDSLEVPDMAIRVGDIAFGDLRVRLLALRDYKREQLHELGALSGWHFEASDSPLFCDDEMVDRIAYEYMAWANKVTVVNCRDFLDRASAAQTLIFEGAQGVLLDEWFGFHPYTTWSTTTHENALTLLNEMGWSDDIIRLGVMRTYTTRHGAGPLVTRDHALDNSILELHNVRDQWQGDFRFGSLDLVAHRYACEVTGGVDGIVLTGCDWVEQGDEWKMCESYDGVELHDGLFDTLMDGRMRIIPGKKNNLERQSVLCDALFEARPVYEDITSGNDNHVETLISLIEESLGAPVVIVSHGPSAIDKQVRQPHDIRERVPSRVKA